MEKPSPLFCRKIKEAGLKRFILSSAFIVIVLSVFLQWGCAPLTQGTSGEGFVISDVSGGLPSEGLWRQNIALIDMDGDGFLDIVAPPPRKGKEGQSRPFIFIRGGDGKWKEGSYSFPEGKKYGYGGVAAGDLNGDSDPDIVLAVHTAEVILFLSDKSGGFSQSVMTFGKPFHSRAVEIADINGDGRPDIIALSESGFKSDYKSQGLMIGINKGGKEWEMHEVEDSVGWQGDSFAIGDINGDGNKDIAVATLAVKEDKKLVWFGDGKGNFKSYEKDFFKRAMPIAVRVGDIDGDGRDEVVYLYSTLGQEAVRKLSVWKWTEGGLSEIPWGPDREEPYAFDLVDLDGDGRKELVVMSEKAIRIYKYRDAGWVEIGQYPVTPEAVKGVRDLRVGRNRDGSFLMVHNLGGEDPSLQHGIKAFLLKK